MRNVEFHGEAIEELAQWFSEDRKMGLRIMRLIKECRRTPFEGIGKPEPLKGEYSGLWSRRIDDANRMVYAVADDCITIYQLMGHYADK